MKHVVLCSGGLDSTVTLAYVLQRVKQPVDDVLVIWVNYGQRTAEREREAVEAICEWYDVPLEKFVLIPPLREGKPEIPSGRYEDVDVVSTGLYVPARNAFLICIGASRAFPNGVVYTGIHGRDSPYADVKAEFATAIDEAIRVGTYGNVRVESPFVDKTKVEIVKLGAELGVPFELTYSCYRGWEKHCGNCPACVARKEAFRLAGVPDVTEYER